MTGWFILGVAESNRFLLVASKYKHFQRTFSKNICQGSSREQIYIFIGKQCCACKRKTSVCPWIKIRGRKYRFKTQVCRRTTGARQTQKAPDQRHRIYNCSSTSCPKPHSLSHGAILAVLEQTMVQARRHLWFTPIPCFSPCPHHQSNQSASPQIFTSPMDVTQN